MEVRVRMNILRLIDIDQVTQTFTCTAQIEASWVDTGIPREGGVCCQPAPDIDGAMQRQGGDRRRKTHHSY